MELLVVIIFLGSLDASDGPTKKVCIVELLTCINLLVSTGSLVPGWILYLRIIAGLLVISKRV